MIQLLYTGALKQFQPQIEPTFSLGGLVSSSNVANDFFSNLFGEITRNSIKNNTQEHICLGMTTEVAIEQIMLSVKTTKVNQGRFRVGVVKLTKDDCGEFNIPKIQNIYSKPVNIKFHNCTSFYGESLLGLTVTPQFGELFTVWSNAQQIGEFTFSEKYDDAYIDPNFQEDFAFSVRYDHVEQKYLLYLIQKNLSNFNPVIEIIRDSDQTSVESLTNQLPSINTVSLGTLLPEELFAIYFERSISVETMKENRKLNCEKIFNQYKDEYSLETVEEVELEIEYEQTIT